MRSVLALFLALVAAAPAIAADPADVAAGRAIISRQVEAFRAGDAAGAFALAAPSIRGFFGTEERFLDMVRGGYAPVYRHRSFEFGGERDIEDGFEQSVRIQDAEGVDWDAVYSLQKQPDGTWKISGCRLVKRPGETV